MNLHGNKRAEVAAVNWRFISFETYWILKVSATIIEPVKWKVIKYNWGADKWYSNEMNTHEDAPYQVSLVF